MLTALTEQCEPDRVGVLVCPACAIVGVGVAVLAVGVSAAGLLVASAVPCLDRRPVPSRATPRPLVVVEEPQVVQAAHPAVVCGCAGDQQLQFEDSGSLRYGVAEPLAARGLRCSSWPFHPQAPFHVTPNPKQSWAVDPARQQCRRHQGEGLGT